jgi:hypothetical protein
LAKWFDGNYPERMNSVELRLYCGNADLTAALPVRNARWVLKQAACLASIVLSALVLAAFAYQVAAEQKLHRAAVAGMHEASLPGATSGSVEGVVRRRLAHRGDALGTARLLLAINGAPIRGRIPHGFEESLSLSLIVAADEFMPRWIRCLAGGSTIRIDIQQPRRVR